MAHFPKLLRELPPFDGPFDAFRLEAKNCDVLFASYPAGTVIPPHRRPLPLIVKEAVAHPGSAATADRLTTRSREWGLGSWTGERAEARERAAAILDPGTFRELRVQVPVRRDDGSLDVYIGYLRRKLEEGGEPRVIHTVRGVGYALRPE